MTEKTSSTKLWFRIQKGFVNVNDQGIWFTSTGNWSELERISEKQRATSKSASKNRRKAQAYLLVLSIIASVAIIAYISVGDGSPAMLVLVAAMVVFGVRYFRSAMGINFMVPWEKVKRLDTESDQSLILSFINGDGEEDERVITAVDDVNRSKLLEVFEERGLPLLS